VLADDANEIVSHLNEVCERSGLQATPAFVSKCLQLYSTLGVRHGIMMVGSTMSGKSAVLKTLAKAMTNASVETKSKLADMRKQEAAAAAKVHTCGVLCVRVAQRTMLLLRYCRLSGFLLIDTCILVALVSLID
jgi:hypothetical protein